MTNTKLSRLLPSSIRNLDPQFYRDLGKLSLFALRWVGLIFATTALGYWLYLVAGLVNQGMR